MKLLSVKIIKTETCGGLLDGFSLQLRPIDTPYDAFDPLCLIGRNGSGKSQFMQAVAEIFQMICHEVRPERERLPSNPKLQFEVEYLIRPSDLAPWVHIRASRVAVGRRLPAVKLERKESGDWITCDPKSPETSALLPMKVIGYTSGENETLSLPFLVSRRGYADEVGENALDATKRSREIPDTYLMLIDYATNLEVLVATQLMSDEKQRKAIFTESNVVEMHSCRCIVQLAHSAAPSVGGGREVKLTDELERYIEQLKRCSTCYDYNPKYKTFVFDFKVDAEVRTAFQSYWGNSLELYAAFHKLAMLNDLVIPRSARRRLKDEIEDRHFASRLPEPQEDLKVFRFEQVKLISLITGKPVDYVSLSDGEHQRTQILGTMAMQSQPGVLFLLDEPESHFNPHWRVEFVSKIRGLPTSHGRRGEKKPTTRVDEQECVLTTHGPFVPSDMQAAKVFIFRKSKNRIVCEHPAAQTYGTTFDSIVQICFDVIPPISHLSLEDLDRLLKSDNGSAIEKALDRFGPSVKKAFLIERARQLRAARESE